MHLARSDNQSNVANAVITLQTDRVKNRVTAAAVAAATVETLHFTFD